MRKAALTKVAVRLAATLTVVLAIGAVGAAMAPSAEAALVNKGCYSYKPVFSTMGQYYKCYIEGDSWTNGSHIYSSYVTIMNCTSVGCTMPVSGSFARHWYESAGRWIPWKCQNFNGYFWETIACSW